MRTYRLKRGTAWNGEDVLWRIWKHTGPLMQREVHCVYRDTCERTARAVLRDLQRASP